MSSPTQRSSDDATTSTPKRSKSPRMKRHRSNTLGGSTPNESVPNTPDIFDYASQEADTLLTPLSQLQTINQEQRIHREDYDELSQPDFQLRGDQTLIRGTDVHVPTAAAAFTDFIRNFRTLPNQVENNEDDSHSFTSENSGIEPFYRAKLLLILNAGTSVLEDQSTQSLEVDTMHIYFHSHECQTLYHQLESYPAELVPLLDIVVKRELTRLAADNQFIPTIQVRPYNLRQVSNLRCLDPMKIDSLIAIRGMIVRSSPIIPDLKVAHFSCCICGHDVQVTIDRGRIQEPSDCPECKCRDSYSLIHNRSIFADKQMVRLQETPDEVPAGQTPASVVTFCFDDLVDSSKPGDRVEVTGIMRAQPRRVNPKLSKLQSVYKTYIDVIHFRRISGMEETQKTIRNDMASRTGMRVRFTPERIKVLKELSQSRDIYERLTRSLAPSIWELDDIKKGILCMLFGGNNIRVKKGTAAAGNEIDNWISEEDEQEPPKGKLSKRGDINILLCGDPGTSKSQLLSYVNKLSSRGIYTSGKGSSAVGLTASVVRDPETKELVLESGALVLSDLGICCIDEFDKMSDTTRAILHEAMEQQTVSIAKAGIIATLNARTSVLASANPTESRYNPNLSVVDNIKLSPTLLSRFDLIYLILDSPNVEHDRYLAQHLVGLYYETPNIIRPPLDQALLRDYIDYACEHIHPELSEDATKELLSCYLEMRRIGNTSGNSVKTISATPRQLESLIRLSEALAKMRYSNVVTVTDAKEASRLMKVATHAAATDPRTGRIDMDMITTGRTVASREMEENLNTGLRELFSLRRGNRLMLKDVLRELTEFTGMNVPQEDILQMLRTMEADGLIQFNERAQTVFVRTTIPTN